MNLAGLSDLVIPLAQKPTKPSKAVRHYSAKILASMFKVDHVALLNALDK